MTVRRWSILWGGSGGGSRRIDTEEEPNSQTEDCLWGLTPGEYKCALEAEKQHDG